MNIGENIRRRRIANRLTATEIASKLGVSKSTISNYEKGIRKPGLDTVQKLAYVLGISVEDLIGECEITDEAMPIKRVKQIPIIGTTKIGDQFNIEESIIGYTDLNSEYFGRGEYFAIYVTDDSMNNSRICNGDIVIVKKQPKVENGDVSVVLINNEEISIERYFVRENIVTLIPNSSNSAFQPKSFNIEENTIEILGKVVEVKIKL